MTHEQIVINGTVVLVFVYFAGDAFFKRHKERRKERIYWEGYNYAIEALQNGSQTTEQLLNSANRVYTHKNQEYGKGVKFAVSMWERHHETST